jgi:mannose-1-phosphate guanylyltransferase
MDSYGNTWAVVLAGGDGNRLRSLTTMSNGVAVPKQFCSLWGDTCLLEEALMRGAAVAPMRRICTVVAAPHRRWWSTPLARLLNDNVIVQPKNRGTGVGILLSLLHILDRDPYANVMLLPADHYLQDESTMASSLRQAADLAVTDTNAVYLLGAEPDEPDPELGLIVPADDRRDRPSSVSRFVEKPSVAEAAALIAQGALINVFIIAGSVSALLRLYKKTHATAVSSMDAALRRNGNRALDRLALSNLYEHLPSIDFSRDILEGQEAALRVLPVPHCGWTDLGTPKRVLEVLNASARRPKGATDQHAATSYLSLAAQSIMRNSAGSVEPQT